MTAPVPISFGDEQPSERSYNLDHGKPIDLTHDAVERVRHFTRTKPETTAGKLFRGSVEGGGCSGMQYGFTFDTQKDDDNVVACEDIQVLINNAALIYIKGAVIDYVDAFSGAGFVVKNPQAKGEWGCGVSFTV